MKYAIRLLLVVKNIGEEEHCGCHVGLTYKLPRFTREPIDDGMVPLSRLLERYLFIINQQVSSSSSSCYDAGGVHVQLNDSAVDRASNTIPPLVARIAIEPVGLASPVGAIGGSVQVHESLSCVDDDDWFISTAPRYTRALRKASKSNSQPAEPRTLV